MFARQATTSTPRAPAETRRLLVRVAWAVATAAGAIALLAVIRLPQPAYACTTVGDGIVVAATPAGPWYGGYAPPLTDQWRSLMHNLRPGTSGTLTVYVKNLDSSARRASISLCGLAESGGGFTPPERREQTTDPGDLAENVVVEVAYASSLRPADPAHVVASGTLAQLTRPGTTAVAPKTLQPFGKRCDELGVWRVKVTVPAGVGNVIQGDWACCGITYALESAK